MKGSELKEALLAKGIVMSDLASKLGIAPPTLFNKFNVKVVKPEFLAQVEEIVGFKIEDPPNHSSEVENFSLKTNELLDIIIRKDEQIAKRDEQIDRLIALLERNGNTSEKA